MEIMIEDLRKYESWRNGIVISIIGKTYFKQRSYYEFLGKIYSIKTKQVRNE